MDYLPLAHRAWVHLNEERDPDGLDGPIVRSGTLGDMIRWMREQDEQQRARYRVGVSHNRAALTYREIELLAARTGTLGDALHGRPH